MLTRKTLGGLHTDLSARVLGASGEPLPGLYAAGEVAGFGGGGMHGYRALEGTFLGGCLFSGRIAGRAAAEPRLPDGALTPPGLDTSRGRRYVGMVSQDLQDRRAYLGSYADRYFELLPSGGHQQLPIAPGVVFTENGQRLRLGQGLWATATGAARTRAVTVLDGPAGQIATWGMVTEAGHDAILGVRLRVDDEGLIDEIDTFVVRFNDMSSTFSGSGLLDAQRLARPAPGLLDLVDEGDRPSVAELRRAADGYLDGVSSGDAWPHPRCR